MIRKAAITTLLYAAIAILTACNRDYDIVPGDGPSDTDAPVISLPLPADGLVIRVGESYTFTPEIKSAGEYALRWEVDGAIASTEATFSFKSDTPGNYTVKLIATDLTGSSSLGFSVTVAERLPLSVALPQESYTYANARRHTIIGRPIYIVAETSGFTNPTYQWSVDGASRSTDSPIFSFIPMRAGDYHITVTVNEDGANASTSVDVTCLDYTDQEILRLPTATSSPWQSVVLEYIPAPGQFINEQRLGGFCGSESTLQEACDYALRRLSNGTFVSLGAFGGYITVGFDHSVIAGSSSYDFAIRGNSHEGSNEPGIIWVSQDTNRNGLPDDQWYAIPGSDSPRPYQVTYFYPPSPGMSTQWIDSHGKRGAVNYLVAYHEQDYYFPQWIDRENYTLRGLELSSKLYFDSSRGQWVNPPYAWGYADNFGKDSWMEDMEMWTGFRIADAVNPDGTPAQLTFVDFIKVQSAVLAQAPGIGEVSCEVLSFKDTRLR